MKKEESVMIVKLNITDARSNLFFEGILFLYFVFIFAHGSIPYAKFIFWLILAFYAVYNVLRIKSSVGKKNVCIGLWWMLPFIIWVRISQMWCTFPTALIDSTINETLFRILFVVIAIMQYCTTKEKCIRVLRIFVCAVLYTIIVAMITSPIDTYGKNTFNGVVSLHRNNIGALAAIAGFTSFYAYKELARKKIYLVVTGICIVGMLATGSRGALISFIFMAVLYATLIEGIKKKFRAGLAMVAAVFVGLCLVTEVPFLNEYFGERFLAVFSDSVKDASVDDRAMYVLVGLDMIAEKPIIGWGPNNFAVYLNRFGGYGREVYSHNNYIELMANYGIVGLLLFYWMYIKIFINICKERHDPFGKLILILLLRFVLCDYQSIIYIEHNMVFLLAIMAAGTNVLSHERKEIDRLN